MLKVLYDPDEFFRERAENPDLLAPGIVVFVVGILGVVRGWLILNTIGDLLTSTESTIFAIIQMAGSFGSILTSFLMWFVLAAVFFIIAQFFDGTGTYKKTLKLTGWGFVPAIFAGIVTAAAMYLAIQTIPPPESMEGLSTYSLELRDQPVFVFDAVFGAALVLWQGFIWTFAVKHAMKLDLRDATMTVAVPVILLFLQSALTTL